MLSIMSHIQPMFYSGITCTVTTDLGSWGHMPLECATGLGEIQGDMLFIA